MYAEFFGFRELPFNNTPDPRFFYSTPDHEEALASLIYAAKERKGFVLLTGEVGAGKTLVTRMMLRHFGPQIAFATIHHAVHTPGDLMESICTEFELPIDAQASTTRLVRTLHDFLLTQFAQNIPVVLVLDEAQNLSMEGFEQLRMIGNLEADDAKLLQIAIVGQPELQRLFRSSAMRQLQQRIFRAFHIPALSRDATEGYIKHRLSVVTDDACGVFDEGAVNVVYRHSHGLPRLINTICDNTLLSAYSADRRTINGTFVDSVVRQMLGVSGSLPGDRSEMPAVRPPPPRHPDTPPSPLTPANRVPDRCYETVDPEESPPALVVGETGGERFARSITDMERRVERVEARLRGQAPAPTAVPSQHDPRLPAAPPSPSTVASMNPFRELNQKVREVDRRVAALERRLTESRIGDMGEAQALSAKLEETVRQTRSIVGQTEQAAHEAHRREVELRTVTTKAESLAAELRALEDQARQTAARNTQAERRARVVHDRLVAQAERTSTLADALSRMTGDAAWRFSSLAPSAPANEEHFESVVDSWRNTAARAMQPPPRADRVHRVLSKTRESLAGLRNLARGPAQRRTAFASASAAAPSAPATLPTTRLARQVEDLLEFIEPGSAAASSEAVAATVGPRAPNGPQG